MTDHDRREDDRSRDVEGRSQSRGRPGTARGRAGTAGTEGDNVPRHEREPSRDEAPAEASDDGAGATRLHGEVEGSEEGIAGEGADESGTLPGSTAGVTGTGGHAGGTQSPGATDPGFPGMSREEAERRRREGRRRRERGE